MDINMLCRTCESNTNLTSMFINEPITIPFKLMACANIQVLEADSLPKMICLKCLDMLDSAYRFKLQCETVDFKLRQLVSNKENKKNPLEDIKYENEYEIYCDDDMLLGQTGNKPNVYEEMNHCYNTNIKSFKLKTNLSKRTYMTKKETTAKIYSCTACINTFDKYSELREHKKVHGKNKHSCKICEKAFRDKTKLSRHLITHRDIEESAVYECEICNKKYTSKGNLGRHMLSHNDDKRHVCDVCGKRFIQSSTLKTHALIHQDTKAFPCGNCGKAFRTKRYLSIHKENIHKEVSEEISYICTICKAKFVNERNLNWHMKNHVPNQITGIKTVVAKPTVSVCNYCGKTFKTIGQLNIHNRIHTGEKPHECSLCKKTFSFKTTFMYHMHYHNNVRPYVCQVCNKAFRQPAHLKNHSAIHTGVKAYTCNFCNKNFSVKSNLRIHIRIHTGERPYVCSTCGQGFVDSNGLKKHIKKHVIDH